MADDKTRILTADDAKRLAEPADDRTRVLSAEEAARILATPRADGRGATPKKDVAGGAATPHEPRLVGDKIVFFCSNGHRLKVDSGLAGKKGNCSQQGCGVPVEIPVPPGLALSPARQSRGSAAPPGEPPPVVAQAPSDAPPVVEPPVVGPPDLPTPPPIDLGEPSGNSAGSAEPPLDAPWDFMAPPSAAASPELGLDSPAAGWSVDPTEIDNPTARLVARLWLERAHGGVVEIHLSGGSVIMPEWYDARWSCGTHALFAALGPDETVTLTAVAWDQIQKVVVRQVQGTPDGMFEG